METDRIICGDAIEVLKGIPDNSIDLIVTSPPYNKGAVSYQGDRTKYGITDIPDYGDYNDTMTPEQYEQWQKDIITECLRVLKPTGSLFYNHKEQYRKFNAIFPTFIYDFPVRQTIIWDKKKAFSGARSYFAPNIEFIFWIGGADAYFDKGSALHQKQIWAVFPKKETNHPAPFPIELPENCILACSKEGDIVLDPFMGSGTTALAAKKHNRHYLGVELNPDFIKEAEKRLNADVH